MRPFLGCAQYVAVSRRGLNDICPQKNRVILTMNDTAAAIDIDLDLSPMSQVAQHRALNIRTSPQSFVIKISGKLLIYEDGVTQTTKYVVITLLLLASTTRDG
jgi:hypothetical protein